MDIYSLEQIGQAPKQGCLLMYTRKNVIFKKYDCADADIKEYIVSNANIEKGETILELHLFDADCEYRAVQSAAHRTYPGSAKGTAEYVVTKEESWKDDIDEYVENILNDITWLGFKWGNIFYASDYFDKLWEFAIWMIKNGHAYIDEQTSEQIAEQKGTPTTPGKPSPYRDRPIEENLRLFEKMNTAEAEEGSMVLRAKLDMANPNMHFRDPIMYRIIHTPHHRTGTKWHAYPMYDFAHGQSDYFEGVTHSICTLEFVPHRPLYDKFIDFLKEMNGETENINDFRPRQIEFNRLNLTYTVMSKRKLLALVNEKRVSGWDDPRMPTLSGMRRRGYSPESIRKFIDSIGYTKFDALNDMALLEAAVREDLNKRAIRVSAVMNPVKLVITNYPDGMTEEMVAVNNPENEADGTHTITFSKNLWIEREDFMEDAPKKFFRMTPGKEVRLKNAYIVKCTGCTKDADGNIVEIQAEYDPESKSGREGANRKVKGTLHWVSTEHCKKATVRIYDRLFNVENPSADERDFRELLNPDSMKVNENCYVENYAAERKAGEYLQFQRIGYFMADPVSTADKPVFNKTVGLKDTWAKQNK